MYEIQGGRENILWWLQGETMGTIQGRLWVDSWASQGRM